MVKYIFNMGIFNNLIVRVFYIFWGLISFWHFCNKNRLSTRCLTSINWKITLDWFKSVLKLLNQTYWSGFVFKIHFRRRLYTMDCLKLNSTVFNWCDRIYSYLTLERCKWTKWNHFKTHRSSWLCNKYFWFI